MTDREQYHKLPFVARQFRKLDISPTTINSCNSGQKAGLTQSSSAQSIELPVHTDQPQRPMYITRNRGKQPLMTYPRLFYVWWRRGPNAVLGQYVQNNITTYPGTSPSVTRRFQSDLYKFIELEDTRRSLKEFVPIRCPSRVMTVLLNCRPLRTHIWENRITRF